MTASHVEVPSVWANRFGYAGLLPFVFLAVAIWVVEPGHRSLLGLALASYGAVIASFLGAIHWGLVWNIPILDLDFWQLGAGNGSQ